MSKSTPPSPAELFLAAVGEQVMTYRETAGLSLTDLAEAAGLTVEQIDHFEHGWLDLPLSSIQTIAAILRVPVCELLDTTGSEMSISLPSTERQ